MRAYRRLVVGLTAFGLTLVGGVTVLAGTSFGASGSVAPVAFVGATARPVPASVTVKPAAMPRGAFVNRPTMALAAYRAIKLHPAGSAGPKPARAKAPTVSEALGFNGVNENDAVNAGSPSLFPAAASGAVGNLSEAEVVNSALATYNPNGGRISLRALSSVAGYGTEALYDPRVLYDADWKRWVISVDAMPESSTVQYEFLLVSKTSAAAGSYVEYRLNMSPFCGSGSPLWDYPQIGQTQDAIVVTGNCFDSGSFTGARVFGVPKAIVYNGASFYSPIYPVAVADGTVTPANVYDTSPRMTLLSTNQHMIDFADPQAEAYGGLSNERALSGFAAYAVPRAAGQAGCTDTTCELDTGDGRFESDSTQYGDHLWNVAVYGLDGTPASYATVYWGEFSIATSSTTQYSPEFADDCSDDFNASLVASTADKVWLNWTSTDPEGSTCGQSYVNQVEAGRTSTTAANGLDNIVVTYTSPAELTGDFNPTLGMQSWASTSSLSMSNAQKAFSLNERIEDSNDWGTRWEKMLQP